MKSHNYKRDRTRYQWRSKGRFPEGVKSRPDDNSTVKELT